MNYVLQCLIVAERRDQIGPLGHTVAGLERFLHPFHLDDWYLPEFGRVEFGTARIFDYQMCRCAEYEIATVDTTARFDLLF